MNNNQKNEVLARYMGGEYYSTGEYEVGSSGSIGACGWVFPKATAPPNKVTGCDLRYNKSFDWLVPVAKMVYDNLIAFRDERFDGLDPLYLADSANDYLVAIEGNGWYLQGLFEIAFSAITFLNQHKDEETK